MENGAQIGILALENASHNTGIAGATGGQFLDLFPSQLTEFALEEAIYKKTVTLFEVSMVLGWLFGGGEIDKLDLVKQAAYHFGMAFQIADDIQDFFSDASGERKMNYAGILGLESAKNRLEKELFQFLETLNSLSIDASEFHEIALSLNP